MKRRVLRVLTLVCILAGAATGEAAAGSSSPLRHRLVYGDRPLVLRSASLKEVSFLKVNVYWVGLYLEAPTTPRDSLFNPQEIKAFVFHFLRDVKSEKIRKGWIEDLETCAAECPTVIAQGRSLAAKMPDVRSSQEVAYILYPDRVDVFIDGVALGSLRGRDASKAILATFLGPKAPMKLRRDLIDPLGRPARR